MELVYIWIEEYKNIKKQGFNFSPNHNFELENNNGKDFYFKDTFKGKKQPNNFFGDNISNVTAIIGKNGSGKSTLLKYVFNHVGRENWINVQELDAFIFRSNQHNKFITIMKQEDKFYIETNIKNLKMNDKTFETEKPPLEYKLINYSNLLDYDYSSTNKKGDISTSYLFNYYKKSFNLVDEKIENIKYIKMLDVKKQIDYLLKYKNSKLFEFLEKEINIPTRIYFSLYSPSFHKKKNATDPDEVEPYVYIRENDNIEDIKLKISFKLIFLLIQEYLKKSLEEIISNGEVTKNYLDQIIDENFSDDSKEIKKMLKKLIELQKVSEFDQVNDKFYLSLENAGKLFGFLEKILLYDTKNSIIKYSWDRGMSTGEKGMFSFFSRLDYLLNNDYKNETNMIILIDEVEATFHPEWQRKALEMIRSYLLEYNKFNLAKINWQLITTSHSPFMASDLPRENIIMLETYTEDDKETKIKEDDDGYQKIGNCKIKKQKILKTFGANIHELYKNSFFMDSTMGEFALSKIKGVIEDLTTLECFKRKVGVDCFNSLLGEVNNKDFKKYFMKCQICKEKEISIDVMDKMVLMLQRKESSKYIIDQIGERVLSRKLGEKYREIFGEEESTEDKMKNLYEKLSKEEREALKKEIGGQ